MANAQLGAVIGYVRNLAAAQHIKDQTDGELLRAFLAQNDQAAFTVLVKRHGPWVLGVCHRVLHHFQDAEDAFQATFLLLARKAASIRKKESLVSWLHGVAYRMARDAKRAAFRRRKYEGQANRARPTAPAGDAAWREVQAILDEEIGRLPEIYRQAFILCCLENRGRAEVARQLEVNEATLRSRLAQARKLLQQRLGRRGVALTALLGAVALSESAARGTASSSLVSSTVKAALAFSAGNAPATGVVSTQVAALVDGGLKTMFVTKAKIATALLLAIGVAAGAGMLTHQVLAGHNVAPAQQVAPKRPAQDNAEAEPAKAPGNLRSDATKPDAIDKVEVRGRVLDPDGKPFAGAELYLGGHTNLLKEKEQKYPVRATIAGTLSGDDGAFEFTFAKELEKTDPDDSAYQILAVAKGYGCAWATADSAAKDLTLRLVKDEPVSGRIIDADGKPVAGAKLTVEGACIAKEGNDGGFAGLIRAGLFPRVFAKGWVGPLPGQPPVLTTGADGKFAIAGIGRDRAVTLRVEGRGIATEAVSAHGATFEYRADVSRPIRGVVRDKVTGKPLPGATLFWFYTYNRRYAVMQCRYHMAITDKQGRYELLGVPKSSSSYGAGYLFVRPAAGQLYLQQTVALKDAPGLEPMTVDIELVQGGVTVSGKVTNKATGKSIAGAMVEYYPVVRNRYAEKIPGGSDPSSEAITGPDGSYTLSVLPGPGVIGVVASKMDAQGVREGDAYMEAYVTPKDVKAPAPASPWLWHRRKSNWPEFPEKGAIMYSRREFIRMGLKTSTLVALAPTIPGFLAQTARAMEPLRDGRILVVVQLNGGNDGINTVVPFADEGYAKYRKVLHLSTDRLLRINPEIGLHPAMGDAAKLLEDGRLAIVQGVGYPNPNRSHFKSMAIWHTANVNLPREDALDLQTNASLGWIGRALDEGRKPADGSPAAQFIGSGSLPLALRSKRSVASAITRPEDALLGLEVGTNAEVTEALGARDLAEFVRRSTLDAYATSERMAQVLRAEDKGVSYPASELAGQLRVIARLIKGGGGTRVYYTSQGYYDTHYTQLQLHATLLGELSSALRAFLDDLAAAKLADRVVVLCFSEFGRRVQENGSQGTDHGTAGPVFLAGPQVKAGLVGATPKLLDLQDGDLKMTVDFRQVYVTVLEDWLGLPAQQALRGTFERLSLFRP